MQQIGAPELILLFGLFGLIIPGIFWLLALIEALRMPDAQWAAAGQSKVTYVILMALLGIIGTLVYAVVARPALKRVGPPPPGYYPSAP